MDFIVNLRDSFLEFLIHWNTKMSQQIAKPFKEKGYNGYNPGLFTRNVILIIWQHPIVPLT